MSSSETGAGGASVPRNWASMNEGVLSGSPLAGISVGVGTGSGVGGVGVGTGAGVGAGVGVGGVGVGATAFGPLAGSTRSKMSRTFFSVAARSAGVSVLSSETLAP